MASVIILVANGRLRDICDVYFVGVPSVSSRFEDFPLRKTCSRRGNVSVVHYLCETSVTTLTSDLLIKALYMYERHPDKPHEVVLVGFPEYGGDLPDGLSQPLSVSEFQQATGLRLRRPKRDVLLRLFPWDAPNSNRDSENGTRSDDDLIIQHDFYSTVTINTAGGNNSFDGISYPLGGHSGGSRTINVMEMVQQLGSQIVSNTRVVGDVVFGQPLRRRPLSFLDFHSERPTEQGMMSDRIIEQVKRKMDEEDTAVVMAKRQKLESRLKLAEEKPIDEQSTTCCCCYEMFYSADVFPEQHENTEKSTGVEEEGVPEKKEQPSDNSNEKEETEDDDDDTGHRVIPVALVPCQHRLCNGCAGRVRSDKNICPLCTAPIEGMEVYNCFDCMQANREPRGPLIVIARPCEHRIWCKFCAAEHTSSGNLRCPLCKFTIDDFRVAKEYK